MFPYSCHKSRNSKIMIERTLQAIIENDMFRGKAIVVIGARQVGKSTLFRTVLEKKSEKILRLNCDEPEVRAMLTEAGTSDLKLIVGQNRIVMIDEAQSVPGIGMTLKRDHPHSNCRTNRLPEESTNIIFSRSLLRKYALRMAFCLSVRHLSSGWSSIPTLRCTPIRKKAKGY